jgi:hypothetical protein
MKKKNIVLLWVIPFLIFAGVKPVETPVSKKKAVKEYDLKYKFKKGEKFELKYSELNHYTREVMGNEIILNQEDSYKYALNIKSVKGEDAVIEMEYLQKAQESDDPQFPAGPDFSPLIGKKVEFIIHNNGRTSEHKKFESLPVIENQGRQFTFEKDRYINEIKYFPFLPGKKVSIGDKWSDKIIIDEPLPGGKGTITINSDYRLIEETNKDGIECLKIECEYTFAFEGNGNTENMDFTFNLSGKGTQTIYFSLDKGMLHSIEEESVIEGKADFPAMGMEMPMKHEKKINVSVTFK